MIRATRLAAASFAALLVAGIAHAEPTTYVLETPGVV